MKYSLRSLMIVVALVCVVLGGRIEYLRRWATYHGREEQIWITRVQEFNPGHPYLQGFNKDLDAALAKYVYHRDKKAAYRTALYRPWTNVKETPPESNP